MNEKKLLVLDVDEVLIHSEINPLAANFDFNLFHYQTTKRPYLDNFIQYAFEEFDVAIWTAATQDYAHIVCDKIIPQPEKLKFFWSRKRCTYRPDYLSGSYYWLKDLKKIKRAGFPLEKVLVIEDDARTLQRSYGNSIIIKPFDGNPEDEELKDLIEYLGWVRNFDDVRKIDKRIWRYLEKPWQG